MRFPVFIEKSLCLPFFTLFFPFSEKKIQPATAKNHNPNQGCMFNAITFMLQWELHKMYLKMAVANTQNKDHDKGVIKMPYCCY